MNPEQDKEQTERKSEKENEGAAPKAAADLEPEKDPAAGRMLNNKNPELLK